MGAKSNLKDIGFKKPDITEAAKQICAIDFECPAPITHSGIEEMLTNAFEEKV